MAQEQVARQVEMAKVRNQMFHLLTPEQQAVLNTRHQQRMDQLREVARMQRSSEAIAVPVVTSNPVFLAIDTIPVFPLMMRGFFFIRYLEKIPFKSNNRVTARSGYNGLQCFLA